MSGQQKKNIGVIMYSSPEYYPPVLCALTLLSREFNIVVVCRNFDRPAQAYPENVRLYRVGSEGAPQQKQSQSQFLKIMEYLVFIARAIFYIRSRRCRFVYSYDMHGFVAGFFASRFGRRLPLLYHNHDLHPTRQKLGLSRAVKALEVFFARRADKVVFPSRNRAWFYHRDARLRQLPEIVMNAPLRKADIPPNALRQVFAARGIAGDTKAVVYLGKANEAHAIPEIIRSMPHWPERTVFVLLRFASEEFSVQIEEEAGSLGLAGRLIQIPPVPYAEVFSYIAGAHLGLAFYKKEDINMGFMAGASNKIFEYMSMGVPVISDGSADIRGVFDSTLMYFVNDCSPREIAGAVNAAFSDEAEYKRKSQACRQAHLEKFNYEIQFKPVQEFIRCSIGGRA